MSAFKSAPTSRLALALLTLVLAALLAGCSSSNGTSTPSTGAPSLSVGQVHQASCAAGQCNIAGACYADGSTNPANSCQICSVATNPAVWTAQTTAACTNGLSASYFNVQDLSGSPTLSRIDSTIDFDWGTGSPDPTIPVDHFSARWTGQVLADFTDNYTFEVEGDDGIRVWVNGVLLANGWQDQGPTKYSGTIDLVAGVRYDVKVEYYEDGGGAVARLRWSTTSDGNVPYAIVPTDHLFAASAACTGCDDGDPCTTDLCGSGSACIHLPATNGTACAGGSCQSGSCCTGPSCIGGLTATYFNDQDLSGSPAITRIDSTVNFDWGYGSPDPAIQVDHFSARWTGQVLADFTDNYTFEVEGDDGIRIWVNGVLLANGWQDQGPTKYSGTINLVAGTRYDITVEYYEDGGGAVAQLRWNTTNDGNVPYNVIPTDHLFAASAACNCDDGNPCTTDLCGSGSTCFHNPVANGSACAGGTCQTGSCCTAGASCLGGLTGNYFNNQTLSGSPALTRIDPTVNFDWANGSPDPTIQVDHFSARWTGQVLADFTENYTFETESDDGIRLWVNNVELVNDWTDQGPTQYSGTIDLVAGTRYNIKIEYYEDAYGAAAQLRWKTTNDGSVPYGIVPTDHLFASAPLCDGCLNGGICLPLASTTAATCGSAGAACVSCDDGNPCTVDTCDGTGACQHTPGNAGSVCRPSVSNCDLAEACDGVAAPCPADVVVAAGTLCRGVADVCDVAEQCDGVANVCPADSFMAAGTPCTDDGDSCTNDWCSGGAAACSHPVTSTCANGLTVTYYNNMDFSGTTVNRIDPNVDFDWGNASPDGDIDPGTFAARWTGQVLADFSEIYTFETESDDGIRLWVNDVLLVDDFRDQGPTKYTGTIPLVAGTRYDIKVDYFQDGGGAAAHLRWSSPSVAYAPVPQDHLFAGGDKGDSGMAWVGGADNGTGDPYVIWRVSSSPGVDPVDASSESANQWGLGNAVMMVPAFSPDGNKLVFIDGDSGGGAGWRKGLSTFDFNESAKTFSNRQSIRDTWSDGDVMKWPTWEPDSRSIIFQTSTPTELCQCSTIYGNMAPTNYYGTPGTLWSIDSNAPGSAAVPLANLNTGERAADANKSYQPTVLPVSVGGYRWAVYTSTRPYGNTLNPPGIDRSCTASQLWVSAIDDTTASGTDRSHPGFWLPNQNIGGPETNSYVNERGYWVRGPCKPAVTGPDSTCLTNDDCCGAPTTAACRIDQPATVPPTRHCIAINPNLCNADGGSCSVDSDCCGFPSSHCITGACQPPAPVPDYQDGKFTRDYDGVCPANTAPVWRFFDWQTVTPRDSEIIFTAQTGPTAQSLATAPSVQVGVASGPPTTGWTGNNVGDALSSQNLPSEQYLRITMSMKSSTDKLSAPQITKWRQSYSCLDSR